jgi:hypothetical protein
LSALGMAAVKAIHELNICELTHHPYH